MGKDRDGGKGKPVVLKVPVGTQVFDDDRETLIHDFTSLGEKFTLAEGGNGGVGNPHFKTSTNRAPRNPHPREAREEPRVSLPLKIIAPAGPAGLPQSGHTTLLSALS